MRKIGLWTVVIAVVVCCMAVSPAYGGDETTVKGLIVGRSADTITLRTSDGATQPIVLTDDTKVQVPKGLGLRKKQVSWANLVPGLRVSVKASLNAEGKLVASEINFSKDDLQTASMIQAGLTPTQQRVTANEQNIAAHQQAIAANQKDIAANREGIAANTDQIEANEREVTSASPTWPITR